MPPNKVLKILKQKSPSTWGVTRALPYINLFYETFGL
ncbi:MAG: hypothetical protein K0R07_22 [Sedimentibacter sp.]|jgi:hypothetical protein|nr:hypothetical protein [Sedimentibacter sp.]